MEKSFTIRVNRLLLLMLSLIGGLFFIVGLDAAVFRKVFDWNFSAENPLLAYAFYFVFLGIGGLIMLNCLYYIIKPPIMVKFDEKGVSFGTGFRYNPYTIPWKYVKNISYGADGNLSLKDQLLAGAVVIFHQNPDIPTSLPTSMGIGYAFGRLTISIYYSNKLPWTITRKAEAIWKQYTGR